MNTATVQLSNVPLLVERDAAQAGAETRQQVAVDEVALDEMLAELGERPSKMTW